MTTVVNLRSPDYRYQENDVYIGRASKSRAASKWQNPFCIGYDGSRPEVIALCKARVRRTPELMKALPELKDKRLVCYCKPLDCHGDALIELMKEVGIEA